MWGFSLQNSHLSGLTRGLVPLLANAGVTAISIGANDGSTPPDVPKAFEWVDEASNTSLIGLLNWPGSVPGGVLWSKHGLKWSIFGRLNLSRDQVGNCRPQQSSGRAVGAGLPSSASSFVGMDSDEI